MLYHLFCYFIAVLALARQSFGRSRKWRRHLVCSAVVECDLGCRGHDATRGGPAPPRTSRWLHPSRSTINRVGVLFPRLARRRGSPSTGGAELCTAASYEGSSVCFSFSKYSRDTGKEFSRVFPNAFSKEKQT